MISIEKRDFLFRFVPTLIRNNLQLDEEALYSTTDQVTADKITNEILKYIPKTSIITDATACIGGTSYSFMQVFDYVIAIELNEQRFKFLINNINELKKIKYSSSINIENIKCVHGDALIECKKQWQDAIFIDPPWGGPEYKMLDKVSLKLSNIELSTACEEISKYTRFIILKVPVNFDENIFLENTKHFMNLIHKNEHLRKIHLLIFEIKI